MGGEERKTERQVNLIAMLLATERPITAREIRDKIPGYDQNDDAFHRMFERDKADLRDQGLALVQEDVDAWGESGYRIRRDEALLQDPGLTPDEWAALSLAAPAWTGEGEGSIGLMKLAAVSGLDPDGGVLKPPRVTVDPNVRDLIDAILRRKVVRFAYRPPGAPAEHERVVEPHGLRHRGSWYLAAFDRERGDVRHFKLSRVRGRVRVAKGKTPDFDQPPEPDLAVRAGPWEGAADEEAAIAFAPEAAWWVERRTGARRAGDRTDGWVELAVPVGDVERLVSWVAGFGARAEVLAPVELRDAVAAHLRAVVGDR